LPAYAQSLLAIRQTNAACWRVHCDCLLIKRSQAMYPTDTTAPGCPLHNQCGAASVIDFDAILDRLPPQFRAAFEAERAERQAEIDAFLATQTSAA